MAKLRANLPSASWAPRALYAKKSVKIHHGLSPILLVEDSIPQTPFERKTKFCGCAISVKSLVGVKSNNMAPSFCFLNLLC